MLTLYHHPFSAASRFVRLILAEHDVKAELVLERYWERRTDFLLLNAAGSVPVLVENDGVPIIGGATIMEYIDETRGYALGSRRLMPGNAESRAEMRRLVEWFLRMMDEEATHHFFYEKILKLELNPRQGGGAPDSDVLRLARRNIRHHLHYINWLAGTRDWLAGEMLTFADFAAAAELSIADYLGEVPWEEDPHVKLWYQRLKSRPSFRGLLAERVMGLPAAPVYADLDF